MKRLDIIEMPLINVLIYLPHTSRIFSQTLIKTTELQSMVNGLIEMLPYCASV